MSDDSLFSFIDGEQTKQVTICFEGKMMQAPEGVSVAAALLANGVRHFKSSIVGQMPRAPYCMMGVCFECLVEIDDMPARQSCLITVREGMQIRRQLGATTLDKKHDE